MSEMTPYISEEFECVETILAELSSQSRKGQCDKHMRGTIAHLLDEVLFLRACLTMHPPYTPVISKSNGA